MSQPAVDGKAECSHIPEAHVVYAHRGWRAEARCRCGRIRIAGKRLHGTLVAAERAAKDLMMLSEAALEATEMNRT